MNRLVLILEIMNRLLLILAWGTTGVWAGATIRTALSADADLTPIPLALTIIFGLIAIKTTRKEEDRNVATQDQ